MLIEFFLKLKEGGVPVSVKEFLTLIEALEAFEIQGIKHNIPAVLAVLRSEPFRAGRVHTGIIPEVLAQKKAA